MFLHNVCINNTGCQYGEIRLANGRVETEGRVEVCINDTWGTVCDDRFTNTNAAVVCQQIGFTANFTSGKVSTTCITLYIAQLLCIAQEPTLELALGRYSWMRSFVMDQRAVWLTVI